MRLGASNCLVKGYLALTSSRIVGIAAAMLACLNTCLFKGWGRRAGRGKNPKKVASAAVAEESIWTPYSAQRY